jgi:tetratricopeptide (TPR) repeat protein
MVVPNARSLLYRYLLSELKDEEARKIEEKLSADDIYKERAQATENELIAAYVSGRLTRFKRERFEKYFLCSEERLEKLQLAELFWAYARAGGARVPDAGDLLRRYFLGKATDKEKRQVEERLHADGDYGWRAETVENELIADYALGNLAKADRERFEQYFLISEERIKKLRLAEAVFENCGHDEKGVANENWFDRLRRWLSWPVGLSMSRPLWQPLTVISVIVLVALVCGLFFYQSPRTRGLNILYTHYAQERPAEARLTGFDHAKYRASQNAEVVKFYNDERDEAFRLILREVNEKKSAAAYHALGQIYLAYNDPNEAVHRFELALQQNPDDARLRNDFAVALMEREKLWARSPGQSTGEDMALASEHLHRATELDPSLLDAHFNLALCHQHQALLRTAEEDWKRYLEKDSSSPWAEEAKGNLAKVMEKIKQAGGNRESVYQDFLEAYRGRDAERAWGAYKRSRVGTGSFITNTLIDNYLSLALSGKSTEAEDSLSALSFIGNIELDKVQDRFTRDLAQFYQGASPQLLRKLSTARDLAKAANERLKQSQVGEAIDHYRRAIELFDQSGDVCESLVARSRLAYCYFQQASHALSLTVLTQGHQECETRGYLWLLGQYLNGLVNVNTDLGKYSKALDYGLSQKDYAKQLEDENGVLLGINRVTNTYLLLARYRDILPLIQEGLSIAEAINATPGQIIGLYTRASKCHMSLGRFMAALDYEKEAFKLSLEINDPWQISRHYVFLGLAHYKLNNHAEAINLIRQSEEIGTQQRDPKVSGEIKAFANLYLAEVYREIGDLDNAVKSYGDALRLYDENAINIQWMRFEAKKGALLTHIKRGDDTAAEAALKEVLDLYEQKDAHPEVYSPYFQEPLGRFLIVMRTQSDPVNYEQAARRIVSEQDKEMAIYRVVTFERLLGDILAPRRIATVMLGIYSAVAFVLAAIGIYGVLAHATSERAHEMGIRLALGAQPKDLLRMVILQGMALVLIGLGLGMILAFALTRLIASQIYQVSPTDPASFALAAVLLAAVAMTACFFPALRATKVDPIKALRKE